MGPLRITDFKGAVPHRHPRLLPPSYAQEARNTRLEDGSIDPLREAVDAYTLPAPARSFLRHDGQWLGWDADVAAVPGPVAADRLYITGDGVPKVLAGGETYPLALPAPVAAPTATIDSAVDEDLAEIVVYVYTFVTVLNEESAPSQASAALLWSPGATVDVSGFADPPEGRGVDRIRVYRSQTSELAVTDLYFVAEIPAETVTYEHVLSADPLQEPISTSDFSTPSDALSGITAMPNGMMAAFAGKELFFCEPYQPHAWPRAYALAVDFEIVAIVAFGSSLAVLTKGQPYLAQGTHPDNVALEKVEQNFPCLSGRGVVDLGYSAAYPSNDGLVVISSTGAQLATSNLFKQEQWRALKPETFVASQYNGRYVFSHEDIDGLARESGMIDLTGEAPFFVQTDDPACAFWFDPGASDLYMIEGLASGSVIRRMDAGEPRAQVWRSGVSHLPFIANFGAALIEGDPYRTTASRCELRIIADGELVHIVDEVNVPTRLPSGFLARRWEVEYRGDMAITAISLAGSLAELSGG